MAPSRTMIRSAKISSSSSLVVGRAADFSIAGRLASGWRGGGDRDRDRARAGQAIPILGRDEARGVVMAVPGVGSPIIGSTMIGCQAGPRLAQVTASSSATDVMIQVHTTSCVAGLGQPNRGR